MSTKQRELVVTLFLIKDSKIPAHMNVPVTSWDRSCALDSFTSEVPMYLFSGAVNDARGHIATGAVHFRIHNDDLAKTLQRKTEFSKDTWESFGIKDLRMEHFIKSGDAIFRPAEPDDDAARAKLGKQQQRHQ